MSQCYAHTLPGRPETEWQPLVKHLTAVGDLAGSFASSFGAAGWGRLAGLWHDVGKFSRQYQEYLRCSSSVDLHDAELRGSVDHASAGAQHAARTIQILGHLIAYAIAGHHTGLLDGRAPHACLETRLRKTIEPWEPGLDHLPASPPPDLPQFLRCALQNSGACRHRDAAFTFAFFVRMLFSCLVDADFLDTENFIDPERAAARSPWPKDVLAKMQSALSVFMRNMQGNAPHTPVNRQRAAVYRACIEAAECTPGLFSLTVPTGGGKTLSSLTFALRHALRHGLRRIVYVVPFTSIIEQTAEVFRAAMAPLVAAGVPDPVLEHHSNLDLGRETISSRLATENWDAPLIVTTSVQFYESLFANRTSRCRKLHNLAQAVIILDEAQVLPVDFLAPCLRSLRELYKNYGSTVLLCTATQPAVHLRDEFPIGLEGAREIVPDPPALYRSLRRVEVEDLGKLDDETLAARLRSEPQVLCIVNTRSHARKLFALLGNSEEHVYLSGLMCPEHRSMVIGKIRQRLEKGVVCRVVSTQLVEAGVDIDFPVVYRSLAGLDSVAQAAGRCNRNGVLHTRGRTFVFRSEHTRSEAFFRDTANSAEQVLKLYDDPLSLEAIEHFFRLYYWDQKGRWDAKQILAEFHLLQDQDLPFSFGFQQVGQRLKLIEDTGKPVIVPWGCRGRMLCDHIRYGKMPPGRDLLRQLQRFTVRIPSRIWQQHVNGNIELVCERFPVLVSPEIHYSERVGLTLEDEEMPLLQV